MIRELSQKTHNSSFSHIKFNKMKSIITIIVTVFLMNYLGAQTYQVITSVDTLQSGDVIITQSDINGNIIDKGLAKPGFVFLNDTTEIVFTPPGPPENTDDVFVDNIDMPGIDGGFLPQDIVLSPHNGHYYIYGYRKVMICNADMEPVKTLDISNTDDFSTFYSDYHQRRIFVHPDLNMVYCLTVKGVLISIDQYFNTDELTDPIINCFIERSSIIYQGVEGDESIWYYFNLEDENLNQKTVMYKYSLTESGSSSVSLAGSIGYDIEMINLDGSYKVYLSTNSGIKIYNPDMTIQTTILQGFGFGHMAIMNDLIFAHKTDPDKELLIMDAVGTVVQELQLTYADIRFTFPDEQTNKLYLSGYSVNNSGLTIVKKDGNNWVSQDIVHDNAFGITENSAQVISCGSQEVMFINKQTASHTTIASNSMGQMYRVAPCPDPDKALTTQPQNGNVLKITASATQILETGGNVSGVCCKGDRLYMVINKFNNNGYILVMNASSGAIIDRVEPTFDFNPVDVFCLDDDNADNYRVYVHYVVPDGEDVIGKLMAFSSDNFSQIDHVQQDLAGGLLEHLISPNGTVIIGERSDVCEEGCFIYFLNYDLTEKRSPFWAYGGCVKEFDFIFGLNYFVFTSKCNDSIYFFTDSENHIELQGKCYIEHPYTFEYNIDEEIGYCFNHGASGVNRLYTINISNFTSTMLSPPYTLQLVNEMFYNPNDQHIYGISYDMIYVIYDEDIPKEYILDKTIDIEDNFNRDDDYILNIDEENSLLYLPVTDKEGFLNSKKVLLVDLEDGENKVLDPGLSYQYPISVIFPEKVYGLLGKSLAWYDDKQNIFCGQMYFSNTSLMTDHTETRTLTGNWDWISFPCMPRLGNEGYGSQELLESIDPLEDFSINTVEGLYELELTYIEPEWTIEEIPTLISTKGYKYNSNYTGPQVLETNGVVLDPSIPIQLSSQYENWIGYFLEFPLSPEDAFVGVWDKLTRITTKDWVMFKIDGQWFSSSRVTTIEYGDGLIVTTSEDCEMIWNYNCEPAEEYEYPPPEYFSYNGQAGYTPFYFVMDSTEGIMEIGLMANDSCVGATVVEPGDSIVEVNAYLTGIPSGVPIEVEAWSGYKSATIGSENYSVVDLSSKKRISRKIYTGENRPYYVISFKAGETMGDGPIAILQTPSPNPFSNSTMLSYVLNQQANIMLTVHNLRGNRLAILKQGRFPEGLYEAGWAGTDASGNHVKNGIYVIRLSVDDRVIFNEKVVLIR